MAAGIRLGLSGSPGGACTERGRGRVVLWRQRTRASRLSPETKLQRSCAPAPVGSHTRSPSRAAERSKWSCALIGPTCQKRWRQPPALRAHPCSAHSPLEQLLLPFRPPADPGRPSSSPWPLPPPKSLQWARRPPQTLDSSKQEWCAPRAKAQP